MASKRFLAGITLILLFSTFTAYAACSSYKYLHLKLDPDEAPVELWAFHGTDNLKPYGFEISSKSFNSAQGYVCAIGLNNEAGGSVDKLKVAWVVKGSTIKKGGTSVTEDIKEGGNANYILCEKCESPACAIGGVWGRCATEEQVLSVLNYPYGNAEKVTFADPNDLKLTQSAEKYRPKYDILCGEDGKWHVCDEVGCKFGGWECLHGNVWSLKSCADVCGGEDKYECADAQPTVSDPNKEVSANTEGDAWCAVNEGLPSCFCTKDKDPCAGIDKCEDLPESKCIPNNECKDKIGECEWDAASSSCKTKTGGSTTAGGTTGGTAGASEALAQIKDIVWGIACYVYCIVLLVVGGIVALVLIFSGIKWFTSDDESGRGEAKRRIAYAIAGLAIVVIACPMIDFLFDGTKVTDVKKCSDCDCGNLPEIGAGGAGRGVSKPSVSKAEVLKETCTSSEDCKKFGNYYCSKSASKCREQAEEYEVCSGSMEIRGMADDVCEGDLVCPNDECGVKCEHTDTSSSRFCSFKRIYKEKVGTGDSCSASMEIDRIANNVCETNLCSRGVCSINPACTTSSYCNSNKGKLGFPQGSYCENVDGGKCSGKVDEGEDCMAGQVKDGIAKYMCVSNWCIDGICREKDYCESHENCDAYHTPGTYYCDIGNFLCYAEKADGEVCSHDYECESGNCQGRCKPATT